MATTLQWSLRLPRAILVPSRCHVPRRPGHVFCCFKPPTSSPRSLLSADGIAPHFPEETEVILPTLHSRTTCLCPRPRPLGPLLSDNSRTLSQQASCPSSSVIDCSLSPEEFCHWCPACCHFPCEKHPLGSKAPAFTSFSPRQHLRAVPSRCWRVLFSHPPLRPLCSGGAPTPHPHPNCPDVSPRPPSAQLRDRARATWGCGGSCRHLCLGEPAEPAVPGAPEARGGLLVL